MDPIHQITVRETSETDVYASGAKLSVRVEGQSFFTGNEAFKKAAELANLVSALAELGLSDENIDLVNVSTDVESGILLKTSSATYHLLIHCDSTELLGRVLSAISSQKNATLHSISWQYSGLDRVTRELLQSAVRASKETARLIAESISAPLLGVHKLSYETSGLDAEQRMAGTSDFTMRGGAKAKSALESLDLSHKTNVAVSVAAEFMVGTFAQGGSDSR